MRLDPLLGGGASSPGAFLDTPSAAGKSSRRETVFRSKAPIRLGWPSQKESLTKTKRENTACAAVCRTAATRIKEWTDGQNSSRFQATARFSQEVAEAHSPPPASLLYKKRKESRGEKWNRYSRRHAPRGTRKRNLRSKI